MYMSSKSDPGNAPKKKSVLAVIHGFYRGIVIYEVPAGFAFYMGLWFHIHTSLASATKAIDEAKDGKGKLN
jgi:hypothetical protein